jgi:hypothetical protein
MGRKKKTIIIKENYMKKLILIAIIVLVILLACSKKVTISVLESNLREAVNTYFQEYLKDPESLKDIQWSVPVEYIKIFPFGSIEILGSFLDTETKYNDLYGDFWIIRCKYRAKNSYGAYDIYDKLFSIMYIDISETKICTFHKVIDYELKYYEYFPLESKGK